MAWQLPFLIAGYGMSLASLGLSVQEEMPRLIALLALAGIYGISLGVYRTWGWLYPLLLSAHMALAALVTLEDFDRPVIGVLFVAPALVMGLFAGIVVRGVKATELGSLLMPWGIPFILFGALDVGTSLVLAATADWAGFTVSASYALLAAIAAHSTQNRIPAYVSTAFVTASVIFASRWSGLGWSESSVVWATQGLLMWWGGQAVRLLSQGGSVDSGARNRLLIWETPLRNAGVRLSWFALAFVVVWFFLSFFDPNRFEARLQDITAVLAILGLLYLGMAFVARRVWLGYLAVALLLASWTLQLVDREIPYAQAYAIPAGLYLLAIAFFERRRSPSNLPAFIEAGAVLLLTVSAFWQSVADEPAWAYAILLGVEGLLLAVWGAANNTKLAFMGGIVAFIVTVLYQTTGLLSTLPGAAIGLLVGIFLITVIVGVEFRREELIRQGRDWSGRVSQYRW